MYASSLSTLKAAACIKQSQLVINAQMVTYLTKINSAISSLYLLEWSIISQAVLNKQQIFVKCADKDFTRNKTSVI